MSGKNRKFEPPLVLDMGFDEALRRFAQTKPHEVEKVMNEKKNGAVHESDLVLPALRLMGSRRDGFITTADLIGELDELFKPSGVDAEILEGRSDTHFSQKVRNLASHRTSGNSFVKNGFAEYDAERHGFRITDEGRSLLKKLNG